MNRVFTHLNCLLRFSFFCCCLIFVFFISSSWNVYIYTFPLLLLTTCRTVRKKANHCVISPSVNQACVLFFFFPSAVMFYVRFTPPVNPDICSRYSPPPFFKHRKKRFNIYVKFISFLFLRGIFFKVRPNALAGCAESDLFQKTRPKPPPR